MRRILRHVFVLVVTVASTVGLYATATAPSGDADAVQPCSSLAAPRITAELNERLLTTLQGNVYALARPEYDRGRVSDSLAMEHMILVLQRTPAQENALAARIAQMHDARSPYYHQWLKAEDIGDCYGVADSDISKLTAWLQSHGFQIDTIPSGKMTIIFSGTAGQVRNTFKTEIHNLNVKGESHIANMSEPQVPAALAPVIAGFRSLNNFFPKPLVHVVGPVQRDAKTGKWRALKTADEKEPARKHNGPGPLVTINGNGFTIWAVGPQDFYTIYNENPLLTASHPINGTGQTLAIVQDSDVNPADVTSFRSQFGLPAYPAVPNNTQGGVNFINGINSYCGDPGIVPFGETEADIDVQWMGATAPAATIDFVSCADTSTTWGGDLSATYIINNLSTSVSAFSVSFGVCEALLPDYGFGTNSFYNNLWQQAVAEGQTPVVAAGDSGDDTCDFNLGNGSGVTGLSVNGLASTPYNIATGGTDFSDNYQSNFNPTSYWNNNDTTPYGSALSYIPEMTWNNTCASTVLLDYINYGFGITYPNGAEGLCNDTTNFFEPYPFTGLSGGGGGISTLYGLPSWQQNVYGVGLNGNYTSTSNRNLPDISLFASDGGINGGLIWQHVLLFCESDFATCDYSNPDDAFAGAAGGTSFTAPMMGGILGLINQATSRQGQANYTLYALAAQEYGTPGVPNTSTSAPSLYTCEGSNVNAISTYGSIFPHCTFYNLNRTSQFGSNSCLAGNNNGCLVDNNDQPCSTGTPNCYTNTPGDTYGLLSNSTSSFENAFPQSAGYSAAIGLGSFNLANLVNNWNNAQSHVLTVSLNGTGTVTSTDGFINCPTTCSHAYAANSPVTLHAAAGTGQTFTGWSGACTGTSPCNLTVNANVAVTANFVPTSGPVLTVSITGSGAVTSADGFINCPGTCTHTYSLNAQVTLTATAGSESLFGGWVGACSGTGSCVINVNQNVSVLAIFNPLVIGVGYYPGSLVVNPATNQIFVGNDCGSDPTCQSAGSVSVINGATLQAQMVQVADYPYPLAINSITNKVYAATCDNDTSCATGTISIVDGNTLSAQTISSGFYTDWVVVNPVTNKIYAVNQCNDANCATAGTVTVIDGATLNTQTVNVGYYAYSAAVNTATNKIYVVNECGNDPNCASPGTVTIIDGATLTTQTVTVDYTPLFAAVNPVTNMIYVVNNYGAGGNGNPGSVTAINGANLTTHSIPVQIFPAPVKVNAVTNTVYVGNRCGTDINCIQPPSVSVIDGGTLDVTANVSICADETFPADTIDLNTVTNTVYLPCNGRYSQGTTGNLVAELDGATNNTINVPAGSYPTAAAVDAPTNKTYVTNNGDANVSIIAGPSAAPVQFVSVTPCRVVDTRSSGPIPGGTSQSFTIPNGNGCQGIPANAVAFSLNVTVVPTRPLNYLTIWPTGEDQPVVSTLNSPDGRVKANAAIVPAGYQGQVSVFVTDTSYLIIDIDGYFVAQGLQFYPLTPCRVVDTRSGSTVPPQLGPPSMGAMQTRDFPVLTDSPCLQGLPNQPQAYSFNATVVPTPAGQQLGYLTLWPTGQNQPVVSTLNNPTATVVANGAIVPAGTNGDIDAFTFNSTDLVLDINGYFAVPAQGGYALYPAAPCRVYDSRANNGPPFQNTRVIDVIDSPCGPPSNSAAYVLNATVVPVHSLGYLTLWPDGESQPTVSTLNAYDGRVTSNIAIVPTMANGNGAIDAYASDLTQLILDISGYFGPQTSDLSPQTNVVQNFGARSSQQSAPKQQAPKQLNHVSGKMKPHGKGAEVVGSR